MLTGWSRTKVCTSASSTGIEYVFLKLSFDQRAELSVTTTGIGAKHHPPPRTQELRHIACPAWVPPPYGLVRRNVSFASPAAIVSFADTPVVLCSFGPRQNSSLGPQHVEMQDGPPGQGDLLPQGLSRSPGLRCRVPRRRVRSPSLFRLSPSESKLILLAWSVVHKDERKSGRRSRGSPFRHWQVTCTASERSTSMTGTSSRPERTRPSSSGTGGTRRLL